MRLREVFAPLPVSVTLFTPHSPNPTLARLFSPIFPFSFSVLSPVSQLFHLQRVFFFFLVLVSFISYIPLSPSNELCSSLAPHWISFLRVAALAPERHGVDSTPGL